MPATLSQVTVSLRPTTEADLAFVTALEADPEVRPWITQWPAERHRRAIEDDAEGHLTVIADEAPVGFVLFAGLDRLDGVIELRRIAVSRRGGGIGRLALMQAVELAFTVHRAQRVWLDVMPRNARARHLYESSGLTFDRTIPDDHPSAPPGAVLLVMSTRLEDWPGTSRSGPRRASG